MFQTKVAQNFTNFWNIIMHVEWESRFTFGQNAVKNINYTEKCFKQKLPKNVSNKSCGELNFLQKTQWKHISLCTLEVVLGVPKICCFWNIIMHWNRRKTFTSFQKPHRVISRDLKMCIIKKSGHVPYGANKN